MEEWLKMMIEIGTFGLDTNMEILILMFVVLAFAGVFVYMFADVEQDLELLGIFFGIFCLFFSFWGVLGTIFRTVGILVLSVIFYANYRRNN